MEENQKAQEQARYELLKCKASNVAISRAEAEMTVGKQEASQEGAPFTTIAADDAQRTAPSSTSASHSNDPSASICLSVIQKLSKHGGDPKVQHIGFNGRCSDNCHRAATVLT